MSWGKINLQNKPNLEIKMCLTIDKSSKGLEALSTEIIP